MINIYCDTCKTIVGIIEKDALVYSDSGIVIYCKACKKGDRLIIIDENQLMSVMEEKE